MPAGPLLPALTPPSPLCPNSPLLAEAWATAGNCTEHCAHGAAEESADDADPSLVLPEDVRRGFRATVEGAGAGAW